MVARPIPVAKSLLGEPNMSSIITNTTGSASGTQSLPLLGPQIALALSGGAAKGDFEVGVVRYLYDTGVRPQILCGTSVGSINALKLAEGEASGPRADGYLQGLPGLIAIWESLSGDQDMWELSDEWTNLKTTQWDALKADAKTAAIDGLVGIGGLASSYTFPVGSAVTAIFGFTSGFNKVLDSLPAVFDFITKAFGLRSFISFDPLATKMRKSSSFRQDLLTASGIKLRLAAAALGAGDVCYFDEQGRVLARDGTPNGVLFGNPGNAASLTAQIATASANVKSLQDSPTSVGHPNPGLAAAINELRVLKAQLDYAQEGLVLGAGLVGDPVLPGRSGFRRIASPALRLVRRRWHDDAHPDRGGDPGGGDQGLCRVRIQSSPGGRRRPRATTRADRTRYRSSSRADRRCPSSSRSRNGWQRGWKPMRSAARTSSPSRAGASP